MARVKREYFYIDPAQDGDILDWLDRQENKSEAIREAIRGAMEAPGRPGPALLADLGAFRAVLREELGRVTVRGNGNSVEPKDVAQNLDMLGV